MTDADFEQLVDDGMRTIPDKFLKRLKNIDVVIADEPTAGQVQKMKLDKHVTLLGLYEGVPLTERGESYGGFILPDKITIFKNPILALAGSDESSIREIVRSTLWHEIAHYFGYNDDEISKREKIGKNFSK